MVRRDVCQPGFVQIARSYAFEETAALAALNDLSVDRFIEVDRLITNNEDSGPSELTNISFDDFDNTGALLMTELERHRGEYERMVFDLAMADRQLAEKLVKRYYLELSLTHRKNNWWKYFFKQEIEEIEIPTSLVRLIR